MANTKPNTGTTGTTSRPKPVTKDGDKGTSPVKK